MAAIDTMTSPLKILPVWPGDSVGIVSPSHYLGEHQLKAGKDRLERLGYRAIFCQEPTLEALPFAAKASRRADALTLAFTHPKIRAILAARGGGGALELLPLMNPELFRENPKAFIGFSDATAILLFLVHQAGMVAFHGPTLSKHAEEGFACTLAALNPGGFSREVRLMGPKYKVVIPGKAQGRVTGGCLSLVVSLLGTPFMPNLEGWMLFLEDIGEPSHRLYRMLVQLRLAGVFEKVSAVVFGPLGVSLDEPLVLQALKDLKIPVVMGIPSGHMHNMLPLPLGIRASLDTQEGVLRYLETPFLD